MLVLAHALRGVVVWLSRRRKAQAVLRVKYTYIVCVRLQRGFLHDCEVLERAAILLFLETLARSTPLHAPSFACHTDGRGQNICEVPTILILPGGVLPKVKPI